MSAPDGTAVAAAGRRAGRPTRYAGDMQDVFLNGEAIQLLHQPAAHTNGDSVVFFRSSDVIVTGDIVDLTSYPVIDARSGGTFSGVLAALNRIIDLAVPEDWQEGGTTGDSEPWPYRGRGRRRRVPRHGDDRPRSDSGHDREEDDARAGQGRAADVRVRRPLRRDHRRMDDGDVRGSGVPRSEPRGSSKDDARQSLCAVVVAFACASGRRSGAAAAAGRRRVRRPRRALRRRSTSPGNWVSVVTEDWRWRMLVPKKGDYCERSAQRRRAEGRRRVGPGEDGGRRMQAATAPPALMRVPGRLRIAWDNDTTLQDRNRRRPADAAAAVRRRTASRRPRARWQGHSVAEWQRIVQPGGQGVSLQTGPAARRVAQGRHDAPARRLPAQERRAVQRERRDDRVLRSVDGV